MPNLRGKIAVVTGASRGAGRGIARQLGEAGATVYVTGRSVKGGPTTDNLPGTIDETSEEVTARGGQGIPVHCDHTSDAEVEVLFQRIKKEQDRLDLLINNVWGGYEMGSLSFDPFWKQPIKHWEGMFTRGVRAHMMASRLAVPLMLPQKRGLIVSTTSWNRKNYTQSLFYDLARNFVHRMVYGMGIELRKHGIAALAISPGWMRTERVLAHFKVDESNWNMVRQLGATESPEYVGRAIVHLAADQYIMKKSGKVFATGDIAEEYGFTDIDGRRIPTFQMPDEFLLD